MVLEINEISHKALLTINADTNLPSFDIHIGTTGMNTKILLFAVYDNAVVFYTSWEGLHWSLYN